MIQDLDLSLIVWAAILMRIVPLAITPVDWPVTNGLICDFTKQSCGGAELICVRLEEATLNRG
jgi:hypothetical protein